MLSYNLVTVSVMGRAGLKIMFETDVCNVFLDDKCGAQARLRDMCYYLNAPVRSDRTSNVALVANLSRCHERSGHVHKNAIQNMSLHKLVGGLAIDSKIFRKNLSLTSSATVLRADSKVQQNQS